MASSSLCPNWWVYLIRTSGNALYCGVTTDVERRFQQHQQGKGAKALRGKGPLELVWSYSAGANKSQALKLEYRIKRLSKCEKENIITGDRSLATFCWGDILT